MIGGPNLTGPATPPEPSAKAAQLLQLHAQRERLELEHIENRLRVRFHERRTAELLATAAVRRVGALERTKVRQSADAVAALHKREIAVRQALLTIAAEVRRLTALLLSRK